MGYLYSRTLTIDHTKVGSSDATNFPVLFSGTYAYLATVANSGRVTNSSGYDIAFFSDAAGTTQLAHEIESYAASTGVVNMWINVPSISHTVDTIIYLFYANSAISTSQENITGTWDTNFKLVQHLKDGTTLSLTDSTGVNTSTNHGAGASSTLVAADGCASTPSDGNYYDIGNNAAIGITGAITLEAWINQAAGNGTMSILSKTDATRTNIPASYDWQVGSDGKAVLLRGNGGSGGGGVSLASNTATTTINANNTTTYIGVTMSGSGASSVNATVTHYKDGASAGSGAINFSQAAANGSIVAQACRRADGGIQMLGKIDEVRISNVARGADYFTATYNSISTPSSFYTVGSETTLVPPILRFARQAINRSSSF